MLHHLPANSLFFGKSRFPGQVWKCGICFFSSWVLDLCLFTHFVGSAVCFWRLLCSLAAGFLQLPKQKTQNNTGLEKKKRRKSTNICIYAQVPPMIHLELFCMVRHSKNTHFSKTKFVFDFIFSFKKMYISLFVLKV